LHLCCCLLKILQPVPAEHLPQAGSYRKKESDTATCCCRW
jgi:hypothetical protein